MKTKTIGILSLTAVMLVAMMTVPAMAYDIDGDLSDWGVDPGSDWDSETAKVQIKENWPYAGGNPGDERCDIEAMYIDEDENGPWIYFGIVTSTPEQGFTYGSHRIIPGDLALDLNPPAGWLKPYDSDGKYGFEYGVKLTSYDYSGAGKGTPVPGHIGSVFENPVWKKISPSIISQNNAEFSNMVQGSGRSMLKWEATDGDIAYVQDDWSDEGYVNYVIEMRIPKSALGISEGGVLNLVATQSCTNDIIESELTYTPIPEFSTIAIPVGMILGLFYFYRRKRQSKEK